MKYDQLILQNPSKAAELNKEKNTALLQNSYAGIMGRSIEPVIAPLGYDWKIGIALDHLFCCEGSICRHDGYTL